MASAAVERDRQPSSKFAPFKMKPTISPRSIKSGSSPVSSRSASFLGSSRSRGIFSSRKSRPYWINYKNPSLLTSRLRYGQISMQMKMDALKNVPGIALLKEFEGRPGRNLLICGMNAIRAELLDMNMMILAMDTYKHVLTHDVVASFYDWLSAFMHFVDRYFLVEEEVILEWIEKKRGRVKGVMRASARMEHRGRLQKTIQDTEATKSHFTPNLPAGEKFHVLKTAVAGLTDLALEYTRRFMETLTPIVEDTFSRVEIEKIRRKIVKYICERVGAEDVLILYTRWMSPRDLTRWKLLYLIKTPSVYRSFRKWEIDTFEGHFYIVVDFADILAEEGGGNALEQAKEWMEDLRRANVAREQLDSELCESE